MDKKSEKTTETGAKNKDKKSAESTKARQPPISENTSSILEDHNEKDEKELAETDRLNDEEPEKTNEKDQQNPNSGLLLLGFKNMKVVIAIAILAAFLILLIVLTVSLLGILISNPNAMESIAGSPSTPNPSSGSDKSIADVAQASFNQPISNQKSIPDNKNLPAPSSSVPIDYVQRPAPLRAKLDDETELQCTFSVPVHCSWKRNGQPIHISDRYSYIEPRESINEKHQNCSIKITNVDHVDFASWSCEYKSDDGDADAIIDFATATIQQDTEIKKDDSAYERGSRPQLNCKFDEDVDCFWQRDNTEVTIGGRYKYVNGNGKNTKDCSIEISNLSENDIGEWKCIRPGDSFESHAYTKETKIIKLKQ
ncbi:hypothetical protein CHUAL_005275 [Chamberlinius hualienensis]